MQKIIDFIKDSAKALNDILGFIKGFFEFIINFISMIPSPFKEILLLMVGLISGIIVYKLLRKG